MAGEPRATDPATTQGGASARERDAVALLREVVFASRARQAATSALRGLSPAPAPASDSGNPDCGLGPEALFELGLEGEGARLLAGIVAVGPRGTLAEGALDDVRAVLHAWVEAQDTLDRTRNHFLRDFRTRHGFDRKAWAPALRQEFENGLAKVNARESERQLEHARRLLDVLDGRG